MTKAREAKDRIGAAYDRTDNRRRDHPDRVRQERAHRWRWNSQMERVLDIKSKDPATFATLDPTLKVAVGYYASEKAAAEAEGIDTDGPS